MKHHPPYRAAKFLRWFCREDFVEEIEGDLTELFEKRSERSLAVARRRFCWDVFRSFKILNIKKFNIENRNMYTLKNYLKIYFRRFKRETSHYLVNTLGLMLGFTVLLFVLVYAYDEIGINTFHKNADRIHLVVEKSESPEEGIKHYMAGSNALAVELPKAFPEIEKAASMVYFGSAVFRYEEEDNPIASRKYMLVTGDFFDIWDINILQGDPKQEFPGNAGVVLTKDFATRLFGEVDPLGKVIIGRVGKSPVLAVMESFPENSTWQPDAIFVVDFSRWNEDFQRFLSGWDTRFLMTWVLLKEGAEPGEILAKKDGFLKKHHDEESLKKHDFSLLNIKNIHLDGSHITAWGTEPLREIPASSRKFVYMIFLIGASVILIASLNFINLSSVQALKRIKEAGIRKVNGATTRELRAQLFAETLFSVLISYFVSIGIIAVLLPYFNDLTHKTIEFGYFFSQDILVYQVIIIVVTWVLSALIPAFYYSSSRSLVLVKNVFAGKGERLRKAFVLLQYAISMALIVSVIILQGQMDFIQDKDLGFSKEDLLILDINSGNARSSFKGIVNGLMTHSAISNTSATSRVPGEWKDLPEADLLLNQNDEGTTASHYAFDHRGFDVFSMRLIEGQGFSGDDSRDSLKIVLNKTAVSRLGLQDPIGQSIWVSEDTISRMQIVGVVEDFHFESLYEPIRPVVITSWNNPVRSIDYFVIRYRGDPQEVMAHAEKVNNQFDPGTPPEFNFLDEKWNRYYAADRTRSNLFLISAILSIVISIIGLFGMINYTVERRTKEMGIRKVIGASIPNIIRLILKDYLILLCVAMLIASPGVWWLLDDWLAGFAYRIDLGAGVFIFAFVLILIVSFLTVISRVYRVASVNPVSILRYE